MAENISKPTSKYAYMCGLSFGLTYTILNSSNFIWSLWGIGDSPILPTTINYFASLAINNMIMLLMHIFWGIISFYALNSKKYIWLLVVLFSHCAVSQMSFSAHSNSIIFSYIMTPILLISLGTAAYELCGGKFCFRTTDPENLN
ncbi:hypothetical protein MXB_5081 [Myxobolus squamalis]|nr:hypothetical protein MXB_5081 [Myxobolus squamalis]